MYHQPLTLCVSFRSAAKLSYNNAQDVIDGKTLDVPVIPEQDAAGISQDIKTLHDITKQLRERRFQIGCVKTQTLRLAFKLDENGMPIDCGQYRRTEAHNLIEEVGIVCPSLRHMFSNNVRHSSCYSPTSPLLSKLPFTSLSKPCSVGTTARLSVVS